MINTEAQYWNERFNEEQRFMRIYYEDLACAQTAPHVIYKPKIYLDGNEWCALLGDDIATGICGFGSTPEKACEAFDQVWAHGNQEATECTPNA